MYNMPLFTKCTGHAFSLIFHIQYLWPVLLLPGSNFAPFEEVKVPVSKSDEFFPKSAP